MIHGLGESFCQDTEEIVRGLESDRLWGAGSTSRRKVAPDRAVLAGWLDDLSWSTPLCLPCSAVAQDWLNSRQTLACSASALCNNAARRCWRGSVNSL